jgi:hypothetical protein
LRSVVHGVIEIIAKAIVSHEIGKTLGASDLTIAKHAARHAACASLTVLEVVSHVISVKIEAVGA